MKSSKLQVPNSKSAATRRGIVAALMPLHAELLAKFLTRSSAANRKLRVHWANAKFVPVCGGGNGGRKYNQWQEDIGPCNCRRCQQIANRKSPITNPL